MLQPCPCNPQGALHVCAERVRMLESKLPHMQQKLGLQNGIAYERQSSHVQHSLVGRVEALEEAVDVLITAQVCAAVHNTPPMADHECMAECPGCSCLQNCIQRSDMLQEQQLEHGVKEDNKTKCSQCCTIM